MGPLRCPGDPLRSPGKPPRGRGDVLQCFTLYRLWFGSNHCCRSECFWTITWGWHLRYSVVPLLIMIFISIIIMIILKKPSPPKRVLYYMYPLSTQSNQIYSNQIPTRPSSVCPEERRRLLDTFRPRWHRHHCRGCLREFIVIITMIILMMMLLIQDMMMTTITLMTMMFWPRCQCFRGLIVILMRIIFLKLPLQLQFCPCLISLRLLQKLKTVCWGGPNIVPRNEWVKAGLVSSSLLSLDSTHPARTLSSQCHPNATVSQVNHSGPLLQYQCNWK